MKNLMSFAILAFCVACGAQKNPHYETLPTPPKTDWQQGQPPSSSEPLAESTESACQYWASLPEPFPEQRPFQFLESFEVREGKIFTTLNLGSLPQAHFGLSREANGGKEKIPAGSFDEFYEFASKNILSEIKKLETAYDRSWSVSERAALDKQIEALKKKQADLDLAKRNPWYTRAPIERINARAQALKARNETVVAMLEENLPGAFTGKAGPFEKSPFYTALTQAISDTSPQSLKIISPYLTKKVSLFSGSSWEERRKDLARTLRILKLNVDASKDPLEKSCQFLASQRLVAQLLSIKGYAGAPLLKFDGRLTAMPRAWGTHYPHSDRYSDFYKGTLVNFDWVSEQLELADTNITKVPRMAGTASSGQFLEALRFFILLSSARNPELWQLEGEQVASGEIQIPAKLLQLSFGLLGIHLKITQGIELNLVPAHLQGPNYGFVKLREDSSDNIAKLIYAAFELDTGLAGLRDAADFATANLLSASQLEVFTGKGGVLENAIQLRVASAVEGIWRIRNGQESEELWKALKFLDQQNEL